MPRAIVDMRAYRRMMSAHGRAAGLTPVQLADSGIDVTAARDWAGEGVLKGTLLCRAWAGGGSTLRAYIEDRHGQLRRVTLWRGSLPYREAVLIEPQGEVMVEFKKAKSGRVYCSSFEAAQR